MSEIKINKGIELMLRRAKKKEDNKQKKPTKGFSIKQTLTPVSYTHLTLPTILRV